MKWDDVINGIDVQLQDLFTLMAPTQPLTALDFFRSQFHEAVKAFQFTPTPEAALKVQQLADQLIALAKQAPGFDLPSSLFQKLVDEIKVDLETIKEIIKTQPPIGF